MIVSFSPVSPTGTTGGYPGNRQIFAQVSSGGTRKVDLSFGIHPVNTNGAECHEKSNRPDRTCCVDAYNGRRLSRPFPTTGMQLDHATGSPGYPSAARLLSESLNWVLST